MKGGRTAPRNGESHGDLLRGLQNFNEGGADCPPKPSCLPVVPSKAPTSMKGGRTAPRNCYIHLLDTWLQPTSMKGGRTAPRNLSQG